MAQHLRRDWDCNNHATASEHIARAIELQPDNADYRRCMRAWLGELVAAGHTGHLPQSLQALLVQTHRQAQELGLLPLVRLIEQRADG